MTSACTYLKSGLTAQNILANLTPGPVIFWEKVEFKIVAEHLPYHLV